MSKELDLALQTSVAKPSMRPMAALLGIFLAAMTAGLNSRVGTLALGDLRGVLGFGFDDGSWIGTAYSAGELIAMPFSAWFAITLSVRRFELWMLISATLLALMLPFIRDLNLLLIMRFVQGLANGSMIPVLMMAALKFLPPKLRLYGLALYAMTATFAPNLAIYLAGYWADGLFDLRWVYWQGIPLALISVVLIAWGLPREPIQFARFRQANWSGMACGAPALGLLAVVLDQGLRLDWFQSSLIALALLIGTALLAVYLLTEFYHPSPFIKLQILKRRNLGLGFTLFCVLLVVLMSGFLAASYLSPVQDYRARQLAPMGLVIALPQLILGPIVALLLYQRWADARMVFATGLLLIAVACFWGAQLNAQWNGEQFIFIQLLHAIAQPMAVVSMLFLATSVVQPPEGPYVSGTINTLRAFGSLFGAALLGQLLSLRKRFHSEMILDQLGRSALDFYALDAASQIPIINTEAVVLSVADAYRVLGILALMLIPFVLSLNYIPAPDLRSAVQVPIAPSSIQG